MDKKNTTIGVVLLLAAFGSIYFGQILSPKRSSEPLPTASQPAVSQPTGSQPSITSGIEAAPAPTATATLSPTTAFAVVTRPAPDTSTVTLENEFVSVHFTNHGGAVRDVALKKYAAVKGQPEPFIFNALHADPMLAFVDFPGLDRGTAYEVVSRSSREVVYRATFDGRVEVTRRYTLVAQPDKQNDPYVLRHETTFRNLTDQVVPLPRVAMSLGTVAPTSIKDPPQQITSGYSNGEDQDFIERSDLEGGSGFFGVGASEQKPMIVTGGPLVWSSISNRFFAAILTPDQPAASMVSRRVQLLPEQPNAPAQTLSYGLTNATQFDLTPLAPNGETKLGSNLYVGPKEYRRLSNSDVFKVNQDKVMQFGFFKFFSQILLTLMTWIHGWFPNTTWAWGYAIVLTTLILKIVFVPFTLAASRSANRMQKIQPEMQAVREKFKDNPQKLQAATMELFKKHKVNPMGGCLPILITIPFFIGFFQMLQSTAELRFQPFLWAVDLSAPDTIGYLWTLPLNIMPILMGATMVIQMRLTPSPTMDNAQAKMMKFMPYVFALFCYNFSCALALYSTVNGIFTIGQQMVINRMKDPTPAAPAATPAPVGGKGMKNVTPKKKR
ncbi:MAG TPA: membrane protein insertase YidC [Opitutus sp.]|nr:membrane protein insertase YidC [Opitutus sp.]